MLDKHQRDTVKAQAELLLAKLERTENHQQLKTVVLTFVTAMDSKAHVLGDAEMVALGVAAVRRRNKDVTLATYLFQDAWISEDAEYDAAELS